MAEKEFWVKVCVQCKNPNLTSASLHPAVPGAGELSGLYHCPKCGWTGAPIEIKAKVDQKTLKR